MFLHSAVGALLKHLFQPSWGCIAGRCHPSSPAGDGLWRCMPARVVQGSLLLTTSFTKPVKEREAHPAVLRASGLNCFFTLIRCLLEPPQRQFLRKHSGPPALLCPVLRVPLGFTCLTHRPSKVPAQASSASNSRSASPPMSFLWARHLKRCSSFSPASLSRWNWRGNEPALNGALHLVDGVTTPSCCHHRFLWFRGTEFVDGGVGGEDADFYAGFIHLRGPSITFSRALCRYARSCFQSWEGGCNHHFAFASSIDRATISPSGLPL